MHDVLVGIRLRVGAGRAMSLAEGLARIEAEHARASSLTNCPLCYGQGPLFGEKEYHPMDDIPVLVEMVKLLASRPELNADAALIVDGKMTKKIDALWSEARKKAGA